MLPVNGGLPCENLVQIDSVVPFLSTQGGSDLLAVRLWGAAESERVRTEATSVQMSAKTICDDLKRDTRSHSLCSRREIFWGGQLRYVQRGYYHFTCPLLQTEETRACVQDHGVAKGKIE
jgi:hypothetical protein